MKGLLIFAVGLLFLPAPARAQIVEYYHVDGIGNVRAVTAQDGTTIIERHDYLPFGEECTTAPRAPIQGSQPKRFTGKERDTETGLDYFGARYYGPKIGRFTTADPVMTVQENIPDPQRWNKYSYGRNNPLRFVDPDGRDWLYRTVMGPQYVQQYGDRSSLSVLFQGISGDIARAGPPLQDQLATDAAIVGIVGLGMRSGEAPAPGTEIVQRAMSRAEADATQTTGLVRGGREGTHFVSDAVNSSAQRAQQRLALGETPEVRTTMEVPAGKFSPPSRVAPKGGMPGGGTERTATGAVPAKVLRVDEFNK